MFIKIGKTGIYRKCNNHINHKKFNEEFDRIFGNKKERLVDEFKEVWRIKEEEK